MKTLTVSFFVLIISSLLATKPVKKSDLVPPRIKGSCLNVDSIYTAVHQKTDSTITAERIAIAYEESEKKSLRLAVNILKKEVDIWKMKYYEKDYELYKKQSQ
jgi:hypothetical protein